MRKGPTLPRSTCAMDAPRAKGGAAKRQLPAAPAAWAVRALGGVASLNEALLGLVHEGGGDAWVRQVAAKILVQNALVLETAQGAPRRPVQGEEKQQGAGVSEAAA